MIKNKQMPEEMLSKLKNLTEKEAMYLRLMWPKSGVLFITSKPGIAKSAISKSIADKMGFAYKDLRLAMIDETDVGLFPKLSIYEGIDCLDHVVPKWAIDANKQPTIIHFEELNRASAQVRNAALQMLHERGIGTEFKFNDNVLMIASGNLGDEDGTDVEEFDSALNGRLIHMKHTLSPKEWMDGYANENVHPVIVSFIKAFGEYYYKDPTDEGPKAYASPRSWTFLSDYMVTNYGMNSAPEVFIRDLMTICSAYIGVAAKAFITYCDDMTKLNINDVLNNFDGIKDMLASYNRDKNSQLIESLKKIEVEDLTDLQRENATKFLRLLGDDELTAYLLGLLDKPNVPINSKEKPNTKKFLKQFADVLLQTKGINKKNQESKVTLKPEMK